MNKRIMVVAANHIIMKEEEREKIKYIEIENNDISKSELDKIYDEYKNRIKLLCCMIQKQLKISLFIQLNLIMTIYNLLLFTLNR
jgi:predicted acetyltransferase